MSKIMGKVLVLLSLLVVSAGLYAMYGAKRSSSSPSLPPPARVIPLERRDTVMGRDFDMIMDVKYAKIEQFWDKTFISTAFITTSNGKIKMVVTLDAQGRSQEVVGLMVDEEGNTLSPLRVIKDFNDQRPLSRLGQNMLDDLRVIQDEAKKPDSGEEGGPELSRSNSSRLRDFSTSGSNDGIKERGDRSESDEGKKELDKF